MIRKMKKVILGLVLSVTVSTLGNLSVEAATYVESCWMCSTGEIYYDIVKTDENFHHSEVCQHGNPKALDIYTIKYYAIQYECNVCGYGWQENLEPELDCDCQAEN